MDILQHSWEEVQGHANTILIAYRPNSKDTFRQFPMRTEADKAFITELSSILGYQKFEKKTEAYINKFMNVFSLANALVTEYNKPMASDFDRLLCYDAAIDQVLKTDYAHYSEYASHLKKWYKSYRGMAKLSLYDKDLNHPDLLSRTKFLIRVQLLSEFINDSNNAIDKERESLKQEYSRQLAPVLTY